MGSKKTGKKTNKNLHASSIASYIGKNIYLIVAFVVLTSITLFLRLKIHPLLTSNPIIVLVGDSDSAGFLRIFDLVIHNFPKIPPAIDYYSNFPWGYIPDTPPIWPYFLALISLPMSKVLSMSPQLTAGLLVVGIAVAAAIPIYWLAKEMFGQRVALATAAIALVHPFFIILSSAAIDHITADLFLVPLIFALFFAAKRYYSEENIKKFIILAALGGIFIAISMMISLTLILVLSITVVPVCLSLFLLSKEDLKPMLAALGGQFGMAAVFLLIFGSMSPWFSRALDFDRLSFLHVIVFGVIAAIGGINYFILRTGIKRSVYRIIVGITILAAIAIAISAPHLREIVINGYYRSIGSYPLGRNTMELISVFDRGVDWLFIYYSYAVFIIPVVFLFLVARDMWQRKTSFEHIFFYSMLLVLGFYTAQSLHYYSPYFSVFAVIAYGLSVSLIADFLYAKLEDTKYGYLNNGFLTAASAAIIIVIMVLTIKDMDPRPINTNMIGLAEYIRTHTEQAGDFYDPAKKPAFSIMSDWGEASRFQYISQRPMVSSANQENGLKGIIVSDRFFQETDEGEALNILNSLNVKYVVGGGPYTYWRGDISKIGESGPKPDEMARAVKDNELNAPWVLQLMANRLLLGVFYPRPPDIKPLHHFRMKFISDDDRTQPPFILFEVVKGARITVKAAPDSTVTVKASGIYKDKQFTAWHDFGKTDTNGTFSTVVPYATSTGIDPIIIRPYSIKVEDKEYSLRISDRSVTKGETINFKY